MEDIVRRESEIECPLFVMSDVPVSLESSHKPPQMPPSAAHMVRLSVCSDEIKKSSVALYSCPSWCVPKGF